MRLFPSLHPPANLSTVSTVLVVQAHRDLNKDWCAAVEAAGHTVISAQGVADGVRRVREGGIDVILVDHWRSEGGLTEFVNELERLPDPPPFVLISDSPRAPEISARVGAAAFVPKPCSNDEIIKTVQRLGAMPVRGDMDDEPTQPRFERALLSSS